MFFSRALPFALAATTTMASCTDDMPSEPSNGSHFTKPNPTAYLVTVAGPTVLNALSGGYHTQVYGVNAQGDAVGGALSVGPMLWPSGSADPIGLGASNGAGSQINLFGEIGGFTNQKATIWTRERGGTFKATSILNQPNVVSSAVRAINDYGQAVGRYTTEAAPAEFVDHCFLWTPSSPHATVGTMTTVAGIGTSSCVAYDINSAGYIVGMRQTAGGELRAFVWSPVSPNAILGTMQDLAPNGSPSYANAINDAGQIVGESTRWRGVSEATIWTPDGNGYSSKYFGSNTYPKDINNAGFVVGSSDATGGAFFWDGAFITLPSSTSAGSGAAAMTDVNGNQVAVVGATAPAPPTDPLATIGQRWDVMVTPLVVVGPLVQLAQTIDQLQREGTLTPRDSQSLLGRLDAIGRQLGQGQLLLARNVAGALVLYLKLLVRAERLTANQAQPLIDLAQRSVDGR